MLTAEIEPLIHRELRQKIVNWPGAFVREINGTETHVHLAVSVAPTITISEFIGQLKGASSHAVNERRGPQGCRMAGRLRRRQFRREGFGLGL